MKPFGICMNRNSLGVEMCSDMLGDKYVITAQTVDRTVELMRWLMAKYGIDADDVVRHYDVTGKAYPESWVRDESLWRAFKARLTAPVEPEPKKEDDEVVEKKKVMLNSKAYECECICKDATNYIKMRSLQQAGFTIGFDAVRKLPSITAPQCRAFVLDGDETVQAAVDTLQESAGLESKTIVITCSAISGARIWSRSWRRLCRSKTKPLWKLVLYHLSEGHFYSVDCGLSPSKTT